MDRNDSDFGKGINMRNIRFYLSIISAVFCLAGEIILAFLSIERSSFLFYSFFLFFNALTFFYFTIKIHNYRLKNHMIFLLLGISLYLPGINFMMTTVIDNGKLFFSPLTVIFIVIVFSPGSYFLYKAWRQAH